MTRWFISTLVLTCLATLSQPVRAQDYFGPEGYGVQPELLPSDRGWLYDVNSEVDLNVRETVENSWFRLEYLNWSMSDPGTVFLGAPLSTFERQGFFPPTGAVAGNNNLNPDAFPIVSQQLGAARGIGFGFVPDLSDVNFGNQNGIRGTFGINFEEFTLEASSWALDQETQNIHFDPVFTGIGGIAVTYFPVITYLNQGVLSDTRMTLFQGNYDAAVQSNVWGADLNFVLRPLQPGNPISVQPVVGLKYLRYTNGLSITGFDAIENLNPALHSRAENNTLGPQFGLRFSYDTKYVSFSADPKVTLGINRHIDSLQTAQLFTPTDTPTSSREEATDFSPIFDLGVTSRVHMSPNLSLFVSYNLMVIGRQSTSWENVLYDSPSDPLVDTTNIRLDINKNILFTHGITIGGEFRFR